MSDVIPTMAVMPITTPRMVRLERILLLRRVSIAMRTTSPARLLFTAQCLDGVERRGARRGIHPEEEPDGCGNADAEHDRPRLEPRRQRGDRRDGHGGQEPEGDADDAAEDRQRDRLGEHLRQDVGAPGPRGFAQADPRVPPLPTLSMMFMIAEPPTTSDRGTTPTGTAKMPARGRL